MTPSDHKPPRVRRRLGFVQLLAWVGIALLILQVATRVILHKDLLNLDQRVWRVIGVSHDAGTVLLLALVLVFIWRREIWRRIRPGRDA